LVAGGLLGVLCVIVLFGGSFEPREVDVTVKKLITRAIFPALGASFFEEWMFRGILLGLWLRLSGPRMACLGTALVFAFVHFLEPSGGGVMKDPREWYSGFGYLGLILADFANPRFVAAEFLTLFVIGLSLGWARLRTGTLWMPMGMHAGWVFAYKMFNLHFKAVGDGAMSPWLVGDTLMAGLLPLATLLITWLALAWLVRVLPGRSEHSCQSGGSSLLSSAGRID
jgi:membrane protease YdiL (CAAX protease family)